MVAREIATHQYASMEYLLSKTFAELPIDALVAAFFGFLVHQRTNLHCSRSDFVTVLSLLGCASSSLGLAISALAPTGEIALAVGPALMVVYVIAGSIGPGKAKTNLPGILRALRMASPIRPTCEALCVAEFRNQNFANPGSRDKQEGGIIRQILRLVGLLPQVLLQRKTAPGDLVLKDLALERASLQSGKRSLTQMVLVHSLLALVGLMISNLRMP